MIKDCGDWLWLWVTYVKNSRVTRQLCGRSPPILMSLCMSHSIIPWIGNASISKLQSSLIYIYRPFIQNYESFLMSIGTKKIKKNLSPQEELLTKYLRFSWSNNLVLNYRTLARQAIIRLIISTLTDESDTDSISPYNINRTSEENNEN